VPPATSDELSHVLVCAVESVLGLRRTLACSDGSEELCRPRPAMNSLTSWSAQ